MPAHRRLRVVVAIIQLGATLAAMLALGALSADAYQRRQVQQATDDLLRSQRAFAAQMQKSLVDGTPPVLLDRIAAREVEAARAAHARPAFLADRLQVAALEQAVQRIDQQRRELIAVEVQTEVHLDGDLEAALEMIDSDIGPARDAGLDVGEYERFLAAAATLGARLLTPGQARDMIARAGQEDGSLRHATAAKVAEKAALAAAAAAAAALSEAKQTATGDLQRAQQYLAQAEATKLLDVAADASALQKLGTQLTAAVTLPDFQAADDMTTGVPSGASERSREGLSCVGSLVTATTRISAGSRGGRRPSRRSFQKLSQTVQPDVKNASSVGG